MKNLNTQLVEKILQMGELFTRFGQTHIFVDTDLTPLQFNILGEIIKYDGLTIAKLRENLIISASSISQLLGRMEKSGLVERHLGKKDKREILLSATPKAVELYHALNDKYMTMADEKLGHIPAGKKEEFLEFLKNIENSLDF